MDDNLLQHALKVTEYNNLDQRMFLYFWDEKLKMYALKKEMISMINFDYKSYYIMEENYYDNFSKSFFNYLFLSEQLDIPFFKFLVLDVNNPNNEEVNDIITLIKEVIGRIAVLKLRGKIVVFYFEKEHFDFKSIIDTVNDDFSISLKVFEGCKISEKNHFFTIFDFYIECLSLLSHQYVTISDLILKVQELDHSRLKDLRPIILKNILEDFQLVNLINSLFENNLNVTQTASIVYMHRNTINNKIDYIKNETGLNIQNFIDAVSMYLLIKHK